MNWKSYDRTTSGLDIPGDAAKRPTRGQSWWLPRLFTQIFIWGHAVVLTVSKEVAQRGYRLAYRQTGGGAFIGAEVLRYEKFVFLIGPQPCTIFLVDQKGQDVSFAARERMDKSDPECAGMPLI
jgi:hypothetical protein